MRGRAAELGGFGLLLLLANLPGVPWSGPDGLALFPGLVAEGEWWRALSFPFAHVGVYHLSLDGAAFLALYASLGEPRRLARLGLVAAGAAGSALLPLLVEPGIYSRGLCGLSGVDHGLLAASALEAARGPDALTRRLGWMLLAGVSVKALWEAMAGRVVFASFHLGDVGAPIASSHLGGLLGALLFLGATGWSRREGRRAEGKTAGAPVRGAPGREEVSSPCSSASPARRRGQRRAGPRGRSRS
jgi:rhomboid family GlyGly-CTERM serine protease